MLCFTLCRQTQATLTRCCCVLCASWLVQSWDAVSFLFQIGILGSKSEAKDKDFIIARLKEAGQVSIAAQIENQQPGSF